MININDILTLLLADGWHTIKLDANGNSTLKMSVYEFGYPGGACIHGPVPGVTWVDQKGNQLMWAPLGAIQGVTLKG